MVSTRNWMGKNQLFAVLWITLGAGLVWLGWLGEPWFWEIDVRETIPRIPPIPFSGMLLILRGFAGLWIRSRGSQNPVWIGLSYLLTLLLFPVFLFDIMGFRIAFPGAIPLNYLSEVEELVTPLVYQTLG